MTVAGYVELTLKFEREEGKWVGTCLELGTSTYAKTLDRVQKDLRQLVPEHLSLLEEAGDRARFFEKHGITFHPAKPKPYEIRIPSIADDLLYGDIGPLFQPRVFPVEKQAVLASA